MSLLRACQVIDIRTNTDQKLKIGKDYLLFQRIVFGRYISKCANEILKLPPVPAIQSAKLVL